MELVVWCDQETAFSQITTLVRKNLTLLRPATQKFGSQYIYIYIIEGERERERERRSDEFASRKSTEKAERSPSAAFSRSVPK